MPRGSKPGERRGGRKKGVPNKATIAREAETAAQQHSQGLKLGKEIMQVAANYFFGLAVRYQVQGDTPDEKKFETYMKIAADIAKDLAPYESARMQTVTINRSPMDLSRLSDDELQQLAALRSRATQYSDDRGDRGRGDSTRH